MKITLKSTLTSLGLLFAALAFSACEKSSGTHNMGNPSHQNPMSDKQMPSRN